MNRYSINEALIDSGMVLFLILFPHFVPLPFYSYSIVCFAAIIIFLKRKHQNLRDIGLFKQGMNLETVFTGIISGLVWVGFMRWVYIPVISNLFTVPDYTEYDFIRNNVSNLIITIVASWVVGGFYEEIAFRGLINSIFRRYFNSFWFVALPTSILFGVYHWQQGLFGITAAMLGGLYWNLIYWYFGKNLWNSIISHAIFDTATLMLIYFGMFSR